MNTQAEIVEMPLAGDHGAKQTGAFTSESPLMILKFEVPQHITLVSSFNDH